MNCLIRQSHREFSEKQRKLLVIITVSIIENNRCSSVDKCELKKLKKRSKIDSHIRTKTCLFSKIKMKIED